MMATRKKPEDLRSHRWFGVDDLRAFGHRSRMRQIGYDAEDWHGKPVIGIINTWSDINPCHAHFPERVQDQARRPSGRGLPARTAGAVAVGAVRQADDDALP
jgi:dihydroxy-acid dehydratase